MVGQLRQKQILTICVLACAVLLMGSSAEATDVRWNLSGPVGAGQRATLELVFDGAKPQGAVNLPPVDGMTVLGAPSTSSSTQMNFSTGQGAEMRSMVTLGFPIRTERQGTLKIPRFQVDTDKGVVEVPGVSIVVGDARVADSDGSGSVRVADIATARVDTSTRAPYVGELIDLDLVVSVAGGRRGELLGSPVWNEEDAIAEPWSDGRNVRVGGRSGMHFQTRAVVEAPGPAVLSPVEQEIAIETGRRRDPFGGAFDRMGSLFGRPEMARVLVSSKEIPLSVSPLPAPAPEGFGGAVGDFRLKSKVVPENPKAGEPLTWTLSLEGTGNWPMGVGLPARSIPQELRAIRPQIERDFVEGDLFTGSLVEDLVLIPERAGEIMLDPVRFVYFDPSTDRYETLEVSAQMLSVAPGRSIASPPPVSQPASSRVASSGNSGAVDVTHAENAEGVGESLASIPADWIAGSSMGRGPVPLAWVVGGAGAPVLALAAYALLLGVRRARVTDPMRAERDALVRAREVVDQIQKSEDARERAALLVDWQHAAGVLLGLPQATPTLQDLEGSQSSRLAWRGEDEWIDLWRESDYALYSQDPELPSDWCERAKAQLDRAVRPRFNPLSALRPRNLLPAVTVASLALVLAGGVKASEDASDLYREGAFGSAAEVLRVQVEEEPGDWVARYNLGLTQAQLGEEGAALADTTSAFLLAPRNPSVRWNLEWLAERFERPGGVVFLDPRLKDLALGSGWGQVARMATPFAWQTLGVLGVGLLCLGAALWVRKRHRAGAGSNTAAVAFAAAGFAAAVVSFSAVSEYGMLGDTKVAMVSTGGVLRSVPTEAQTAQAQRPIPAGTLVRRDGEFLGWIRVELASGETGWLRSQALTPLYPASAV